MTTPTDAIAGLIERLQEYSCRARAAHEENMPMKVWNDHLTMDIAATQLDSLLKERDALRNEINDWANEVARYKSYAEKFDQENAALQVRVKELEVERDDALGRVDELEQNAEVVSDEFEKDCWKEMRSLLSECKFDWRDVEPDGVTAADAREYLHETLKELESSWQREQARATILQQERDEAYERLKPLSEVVLPWGNVGSGMVSANAVLAARDLVRRLAGPEKEGK